jgi:hypothetical protein
MGKGECACRVNRFHSVEGRCERLTYRHGRCWGTMEDTAAFFHIVLGLQLRTPERPGRLREGARRRCSSRDVA